jgi:hypothetical protein
MAIEIAEESLSPREAIALFREILEDPSMKEGVFYNAVSSGYIDVAKSNGRLKYYSRTSVIRAANERKETMSLMTGNQVIEKARKHGVTLKNRDIIRLIDSGQLVTTKKFGGIHYFDPTDVDSVIASLVDINALKKKVNGLKETVQAVRWINDRLEEMGRTDRLKLSTFYKQVGDSRGLLLANGETFGPDVRIPAGSKNAAWRWYWSEETLKKHPIFEAPLEMPGADEIEPVRVTGSRSLRLLEEQWGDLATRHGLREEGLSVYLTRRKNRKVVPVGYDGTTQWFPVKYVPPMKPHRNADLKAIRDMLNEG